jgi:hypothetical protein
MLQNAMEWYRKAQAIRPPTMMMRYSVGILVFVFCNATGNSTEQAKRVEPESTQASNLRDDLTRRFNEFDPSDTSVRRFLVVRDEGTEPDVSVRAMM